MKTRASERDLTRTRVNRFRTVAMELGACRWGRIVGASGSRTLRKPRVLASPESGGGKGRSLEHQESVGGDAEGGVTAQAWRQPRPSKWARPSSLFSSSSSRSMRQRKLTLSTSTSIDMSSDRVESLSSPLASRIWTAANRANSETVGPLRWDTVHLTWRRSPIASVLAEAGR